MSIKMLIGLALLVTAFILIPVYIGDDWQVTTVIK